MNSEGVSSSEVEVMAKPSRRRFTAEYKLGVLREAEGCKGRGELGAFLRREGLYSSNLTQWRKQRERGELEGLSRKRGPSPKARNPLADKVRVLERENVRLKARAERAEGLVELQKKVSEILGIELNRNGKRTDGNDWRAAQIIWDQADLPGFGNCAGQLLSVAQSDGPPEDRAVSYSGVVI